MKKYIKRKIDQLFAWLGYMPTVTPVNYTVTTITPHRVFVDLRYSLHDKVQLRNLDIAKEKIEYTLQKSLIDLLKPHITTIVREDLNGGTTYRAYIDIIPNKP